jgi:hypothetical protein
LPRGLGLRGEDRKAKVEDRGCAVVSFWLESSARISGRVINPEGLPVKNAEIVIIQANKERYNGYVDYAYSDANGAYSLKFIPPGRYILQTRYDGMTSQNRPFPVLYYPGTADRSQARIFTVEQGESIELDITVPPMPAESEIRGQVVWPDGKPVTNATVGYILPKDAIVYGLKLDNEGRFSFTAYNGITLSVSASVEVEKGKYANAYSGPITVGVNTEPIKLILQTAPPQ